MTSEKLALLWSEREPGGHAEAMLVLVLVVIAHVAVLRALTFSPASPAPPRAPVMVELLAPPSVMPLEAAEEHTVRRETPAPKRAPPSRALVRPRPSEPVPERPVARPDAPRPPEKQVSPAPQPLPALPPVEALGADAADSPSVPTPPSDAARDAPPRSGAVPSASAPAGSAPYAEVTPPRFDAPHLRNPSAEYPRLARRLGEQGRVLLRVFVNSAGTAEKIEVQSSSGSPRLDRAAREAVARWQFVPARHGDEPVAAWLLVPIVFRLEG